MRSVVSDEFWNIVDKQILALAGEWTQQYSVSDLVDTMKKPYWWEYSPFKDARLEYEDVQLSFKQWMNAVEAILGRPKDDVFEEELRFLIIAHIVYTEDQESNDKDVVQIEH